MSAWCWRSGCSRSRSCCWRSSAARAWRCAGAGDRAAGDRRRAARRCWSTGVPLNASSLMGCVLLVGLVVKNGILLLEQFELTLAEGLPLDDALLAAGSLRVRPILMTTIATLAGLAPLALGVGAGAEIQRPLAIAVIGGLLRLDGRQSAGLAGAGSPRVSHLPRPDDERPPPMFNARLWARARRRGRRASRWPARRDGLPGLRSGDRPRLGAGRQHRQRRRHRRRHRQGHRRSGGSPTAPSQPARAARAWARARRPSATAWSGSATAATTSCARSTPGRWRQGDVRAADRRCPTGWRTSRSTRELWVTTPRDQTITIAGVGAARSRARSATIKLEGEPEGYAVDDARGLFYTNLEDKDRTLAIDVKTRKVVADWPAGVRGGGPARAGAGPARGGWLFVACTDGAGELRRRARRQGAGPPRDRRRRRQPGLRSAPAAALRRVRATDGKWSSRTSTNAARRQGHDRSDGEGGPQSGAGCARASLRRGCPGRAAADRRAEVDTGAAIGGRTRALTVAIPGSPRRAGARRARGSARPRRAMALRFGAVDAPADLDVLSLEHLVVLEEADHLVHPCLGRSAMSW